MSRALQIALAISGWWAAGFTYLQWEKERRRAARLEKERRQMVEQLRQRSLRMGIAAEKALLLSPQQRGRVNDYWLRKWERNTSPPAEKMEP